MTSGELVVQAGLHSNAASWVLIPITLNGLHSLSMVLDTGAPVSEISPDTAAELSGLGLLKEPVKPRYHHRLEDITTTQGQSLPPLDIVVLPRLARMKAVGIEVMGLLGLDFLILFASVCYDVDARRLVLTPRVG